MVPDRTSVGSSFFIWTSPELDSESELDPFLATAALTGTLTTERGNVVVFNEGFLSSSELESESELLLSVYTALGLTIGATLTGDLEQIWSRFDNKMLIFWRSQPMEP